MKKWVNFETLNEVFDIKSDLKGAWIDTSKDQHVAPPWNKGVKTGQRTHNSQEVVMEWKEV